MSLYDEFKLPYLRVRDRLFESLRAQHLPNLEKIGRTLPVIVRQDEQILFPKVLRSSFDLMAYTLLLLYVLDGSDYQISLVIDQILFRASIHHYEGKWKIWWNLAEWFEFGFQRQPEKFQMFQEMRGSPASERQVKRLKKSERNQADPQLQEVDLFSQYDFIEFLLTQMSLDDLFGNLLKRAIQLGKLIKVESLDQRRKRISRQPVRRKVRHRGYDDKGHLPDPQMKVWREANREINPPPKDVRYSTLNQVVDWGQDPNSS